MPAPLQWSASASLGPVTAAHAVTGVAPSKGGNLPGLKCAQLLLTNDADAAMWADRGVTFEQAELRDAAPGTRGDRPPRGRRGRRLTPGPAGHLQAAAPRE